MPPVRNVGKSALGGVGNVRNFVRLMREMSFDEERAQAERQPQLLVLAPSHMVAEALARGLTGADSLVSIQIGALDQWTQSFDPYDLIVVQSAAGGTDRPKGADETRLVVVTPADLAGDRIEALRGRIVARLPDLAVPLGRYFPAFRAAAASEVINETSRVNAQFALVANIPSAIPIVGAVASAGADFLVLTKNQLMMVFKLAAIHGRDLSDHKRIIRELVPVVGAGFVWRTLAREAASFLPFMAGTVPKVAIAFTGTFAAGRAADFYFRAGKRPDRRQLREIYAQAADALKQLPPLRDRGESDQGQAAG